MDSPTPKFPGMVHPKDGMERASLYFQVGPFSGAWLIHCHGVDYRGGFAVFWAVSPQGLKKEVLATNRVGLEVRQFDPPENMLTYIPKCFGVFVWDSRVGIFNYRKGDRFEDSMFWDAEPLVTKEMKDLLLPLLDDEHDHPKDSGCHGDPAKTRTF